MFLQFSIASQRCPLHSPPYLLHTYIHKVNHSSNSLGRDDIQVPRHLLYVDLVLRRLNGMQYKFGAENACHLKKSNISQTSGASKSNIPEYFASGAHTESSEPLVYRHIASYLYFIVHTTFL